MKNNFQKNKIIIIGFLILAILLLNFFQKDTKNFFYLFSSPIQKAFLNEGGKVNYFFETIFEIRNLKAENEELKLKYQELLSENVILRELKKENEELREALDVGLKDEFDLISVQVIAKTSFEDSILIDKGRKHGVLENLPVISAQRTLVGIVGEVYEDFSTVYLLSNKKTSFNAKTISRFAEDSNSNQEIVQGVIKGKGNSVIKFEFLLKENEIERGDLIVTTGSEGIFPRDILVGKIKEVIRNDLAPFQSAEVDPSLDIKRIKTAFIISK